MTLLNGIISAPVSLGDIANAVGEPSTETWTTEKINTFSRHKPVRSTSRGVLTDADFANLNFGFIWEQGSYPLHKGLVASGSDARYTLLQAGVDGEDWWQTAYELPTGGSSPFDLFRALDFDGYNINAVAPFRNLTFTPIRNAAYVEMSMRRNPDAEIFPEDFPDVDADTWHYAVVYTDFLDPERTPNIVWGLSINNAPDTIVIQVPATVGRTYYAQFCVGKPATLTGDPETLMMLPGGYMSFTVPQTQVTQYFTASAMSGFRIEWDDSEQHWRIVTDILSVTFDEVASGALGASFIVRWAVSRGTGENWNVIADGAFDDIPLTVAQGTITEDFAYTMRHAIDADANTFESGEDVYIHFYLQDRNTGSASTYVNYVEPQGVFNTKMISVE